MITKIVFIRHGETDGNRKQLYLGHTDLPLNPTGIAQINNLKQVVESERFDRVYSSSLLRCRQTTEILFGKELIAENDLREMNFGIFDGQTHADISKQYSQEYQCWIENPVDYRITGGESLKEFYQRVTLSFRNILKENYGHKLAIITHGGCIRAILSYYLGKGIEDYWKFKIDIASFSRLEFDDNFPYLTSLNENIMSSTK